MRISDWSSDVCSSDLSFRGCPVPCLLLPSNRLSGDGHAIGRNTDAQERRRERGAAGIDGVVRAQGAQRVSHGPSNPVAGERRPGPPFPLQTGSTPEHADTSPARSAQRPRPPCASSPWAKIGRAHVCTPVTTAHPVCRLLLEKKKKEQY